MLTMLKSILPQSWWCFSSCPMLERAICTVCTPSTPNPRASPATRSLAAAGNPEKPLTAQTSGKPLNTLTYQNLLFCRVPINSMLGFIIRTYKKVGFGRFQVVQHLTEQPSTSPSPKGRWKGLLAQGRQERREGCKENAQLPKTGALHNANCVLLKHQT